MNLNFKSLTPPFIVYEIQSELLLYLKQLDCALDNVQNEVLSNRFYAKHEYLITTIVLLKTLRCQKKAPSLNFFSYHNLKGYVKGMLNEKLA